MTFEQALAEMRKGKAARQKQWKVKPKEIKLEDDNFYYKDGDNYYVYPITNGDILTNDWEIVGE